MPTPSNKFARKFQQKVMRVSRLPPPHFQRPPPIFRAKLNPRLSPGPFIISKGGQPQIPKAGYRNSQIIVGPGASWGPEKQAEYMRRKLAGELRSGRNIGRPAPVHAFGMPKPVTLPL